MRNLIDWYTSLLLMDSRALVRAANMQLQHSRESIREGTQRVQLTCALVARSQQAIRESERALERLQAIQRGGTLADLRQPQDRSGDLFR
jgi:hypothetical protein